MPKKKQKKEEGAPLWVMTYGDMMSLLLVFFILILSLSEIRREDEYMEKVELIQKAFGLKGGGGDLPTENDPEMSLVEIMDLISEPEKKIPERSEVLDPAPDGKHEQTTTVRPGIQQPVAGLAIFEPGSWELLPAQRRRLVESGEFFRGLNNKIEIHGHAASHEAALGEASPDVMTLSFRRARAVMRALTEEMGVRRERIRLVANGDLEPRAVRAYGEAAQQPNRRVEIILTEGMVEEFQRPVEE